MAQVTHSVHTLPSRSLSATLLPSLSNHNVQPSLNPKRRGVIRPMVAAALSPPSPAAPLSSSRLASLAECEEAQMQQIQRLALEPNHHLTVSDCMTQGDLVIATPDTPIYEALEALVKNRITGMPVVDTDNKVVGVVSDYDLLALDSICGGIASCDVDAAAAAVDSATHDLFPAPASSWKVFREIQKLLSKAQGQTVGDVMTPEPITVRPLTNIEDAARLLLGYQYRRLPVVNEDGKLLGLLTRGNVVRAALMLRRVAENRVRGAN